LANPITYGIEVRQLREALAVMKHLGIKVIDLPGTPVRLLVKSLTSFPLWLGRTVIGRPLAKARGAKMPSFQIDLQAGRTRSEVEYINGAVVRFGEKTGIPTPVNRILTATLVDLAAGKLDRDTFFDRPDFLYKKIKEIS
jgi:2-dehydropantoate 2-reductase